MSVALLKKLVRNFPENGPKLLLENPANVCDLLRLVHEPMVDAIDFSTMTVERTHFIQPDYRHLAVDLLLKARLHLASAASAGSIFIYLLVEHQSAPERFFMLRLAEYLLQAYKLQKKAGDESHASDSGLMLNPVLPLVLYTGERPWPKIEAMADLVEAGAIFHDAIPAFQPRFLNLKTTSGATLTTDGGIFGQMLKLLQQRHASEPVFRRTLEEVVPHLERMSQSDRVRWAECLHYVVALVHNARGENEHEGLRETVDRSLQNDVYRREAKRMGRTIAEMLMDKGRVEGEAKGKRGTLLMLLRKRFKKVPRKIENRIAATNDINELDTWTSSVLDAATLDDVGIPLDD